LQKERESLLTSAKKGFLSSVSSIYNFGGK